VHPVPPVQQVIAVAPEHLKGAGHVHGAGQRYQGLRAGD
jgi:hypothetical protein